MYSTLLSNNTIIIRFWQSKEHLIMGALAHVRTFIHAYIHRYICLALAQHSFIHIYLLNRYSCNFAYFITYYIQIKTLLLFSAHEEDIQGAVYCCILLYLLKATQYCYINFIAYICAHNPQTELSIASAVLTTYCTFHIHSCMCPICPLVYREL